MPDDRGFLDLGFAKLDTDRCARRGFSEVIFCQRKTPAQIKKIARELIKNKQDLILTKLDGKTFKYLKKFFPGLKYNKDACLGYVLSSQKKLKKGAVAVISAGTSDIPVAEEAVVTLEAMGNRVLKFYDIGVAGVHRLIGKIGLIRKAEVIIVVAGMEGALASIVSGLVKCPVIAVPTSCGYGANFSGLSALLTMLNSCSPGVVVVNIDNGFGAAYFANLINK